MSIPAKPLLLLLAFGLAACSTASRARMDPVPDWEAAGPPRAPGSITKTAAAPPNSFTPVPPRPATPAPVASLAFASETWVSLARWSRAEHLSEPVAVPPAASLAFSVRAPAGELVLRAGSVVAFWNGLEIYLGFAPQYINGQLFVHALDLRKTLSPLLDNSAGGKGHIVVIDPGHGGENAGTRSVMGNHYEKEFTLDWALRLEQELSRRGWQVFLTRHDDTDLALSNRVAFAAGHRADVFLSLHFNSAGAGDSEAGLETYCLTPAGMPSSLTRGSEDDSATVFPNNGFDADNLRLALEVHRALLQVNGHNDRGVRRARFPGVLRNQHQPAVLIEGGYLSNLAEARRIADPQYRQKLAIAVADALEAERASGGQAGFASDASGSLSPSNSAPGPVSAVPISAPRQHPQSASEELSHSAEIP